MNAYIVKYGVIGGIILLLFGLLSQNLMSQIDFKTMEYIGFGAMVLALMTLFFGIKSYRDKKKGGEISFLKGLTMALMTGLIVSVFYVAGWVFSYDPTDTAFADQMYVEQLKEWKEQGFDEAKIEIKSKEFGSMMAYYNDSLPLRILVTFLEIVPMIIVVSLASAFFLKSPLNNWR